MLGAGRSRRRGGVKGDPSCTHGEQAKDDNVDEDGVLTKSNERGAGARSVLGFHSLASKP